MRVLRTNEASNKTLISKSDSLVMESPKMKTTRGKTLESQCSSSTRKTTWLKMTKMKINKFSHTRLLGSFTVLDFLGGNNKIFD